MKTIIYLAQVSACTGIFYLFYHLVLSRLTFFTINRWYLLGTLILSFVIPLISIPAESLPQSYQVSPVSFSMVPQTYTYAGDIAKESHLPMEQPFDWFSMFPILYFLVAGILGAYLIITLFVLLKRISSNKSDKAGKIKLLKGDKCYKNGSFFNYIFINDEALSPSELKQIIAHELVHIEKKHSVDKMICRISQVILWFNPFVYAYSFAIENNHEYEVDREMASGSDKEAYAELILRLATSGHPVLYNHFSRFPLRKRIAMLFNSPSANMKKIIYMLVLPLIVISCMTFGDKKEDVIPRDKVKLRDEKLSAVDGVDKLGENIVVLIDDKIYDKAILYKIGLSCIRGTAFYDKEWSIKNYGLKAADGVVKIRTAAGKITYLTEYEKKYLQKLKETKNGFYTRVSFKKSEGIYHDDEEPYDYDIVSINLPGKGGGSHSIQPEGKVGFVIGNRVYKESQVNEFKKALIGTKLKGGSGVGGNDVIKVPGIDLSGYDIIFYYNAERENYNIDEVKTDKRLIKVLEEDSKNKDPESSPKGSNHSIPEEQKIALEQNRLNEHSDKSLDSLMRYADLLVYQKNWGELRKLAEEMGKQTTAGARVGPFLGYGDFKSGSEKVIPAVNFFRGRARMEIQNRKAIDDLKKAVEGAEQ